MFTHFLILIINFAAKRAARSFSEPFRRLLTDPAKEASREENGEIKRSFFANHHSIGESLSPRVVNRARSGRARQTPRGDGAATRKVAVEYPIGHRRRRHVKDNIGCHTIPSTRCRNSGWLPGRPASSIPFPLWKKRSAQKSRA